MIYRKNDNPKCHLCKNATYIKGTRNIQCSIHGTRPMDYVCKKYDYDIFKREIKPKTQLRTFKFRKEDFEI
ncbi:MAG: hypothetical protein IJ365_06565 [Clostridia bacterium]|nr:hypothetical protein [Clostridia bacterium]